MNTPAKPPPPQNGAAEISGVLLVDKPSGWTSHDAVMVARRALGMRRIGHTGTLDPAATGLLVLLAGGATRLQSRFQQAGKTYSGTMLFGATTDTWDADGSITKVSPLPPVAPESFVEAARSLAGEITQPVPPYSAVKFHGEPLHRIARRGGQLPEQMLRRITIYGWDSLEWRAPELAFTVRCSGGTYVRSLAQMLGEKFGCGAHLKSLRRLEAGGFRVDGAIPADALKTIGRDELYARLLPVENL
ncbi:MAG: tRNA pseudouridine(55) synthase TruB [Elusimicrobiales bacterium]